MMIRTLLATGFLVLVAPAAAATLVGTSMDVSYRFPDVDTVYPGGNPSVSPFVVGAGVESIVNVEDVTFISVDFATSTAHITFDTILTNPVWTSTSFNGLLFEGEGVGKILSATVLSSSMAGFDDSRILLSGGRLGFNWNGLSYVDGTEIKIGFVLVPEPGTWAMLIAGFGLVGMAARRNRRPEVVLG